MYESNELTGHLMGATIAVHKHLQLWNDKDITGMYTFIWFYLYIASLSYNKKR